MAFSYFVLHFGVTEDLGASPLAESGAGDEVIMSTAGTSPAPCSHATPTSGMKAKRRALDEMLLRERAADEKHKEEAEREQAAVVSPSAVVVQ